MNGPERVAGNCAGIAIGQKTVSRDKATGAVVPHSLSAFEKVIAINLVGTCRVIASAASSMVTLDPGHPGRRAGRDRLHRVRRRRGGADGPGAYAASKGGVAAMTLPVARDLARDGVRVNTILPGLFSAPMLEGPPKRLCAHLAPRCPSRRGLGQPAEYAALVRHICENEMLNGAQSASTARFAWRLAKALVCGRNGGDLPPFKQKAARGKHKDPAFTMPGCPFDYSANCAWLRRPHFIPLMRSGVRLLQGLGNSGKGSQSCPPEV